MPESLTRSSHKASSLRGNHARIIRIAACLTLCAGGSGVTDALAQAYPSKPLRLVVGFAPGGSTDVSARLLATRLSETLGRPVIVDNRPGAGTAVANAFVAKAPPDGYTLLSFTASGAILSAMRNDLNYNAERDFAAISRVATTTYALIVHPSVPVRTPKELIALAAKHRGKLAFGSEGVGTSGHLAGELLKSMAKIDMLHVPYKGGSESVTAVASGQVDLCLPTITSAVPLLNAGKVKILAVTSRTRSALKPEIPTLHESGLPGYDRSSWNGLMAPAGVPKEIVATLHGAVVKAVQHPEMVSGLQKLGLEPVSSTP